MVAEGAHGLYLRRIQQRPDAVQKAVPVFIVNEFQSQFLLKGRRLTFPVTACSPGGRRSYPPPARRLGASGFLWLIIDHGAAFVMWKKESICIFVKNA